MSQAPLEGRLGVGHLAVGIDVRPQHLGAGSARVDLSLEHGRKPFEPALAGDGGAGAAFGLVWQVEFFELFFLAAGEDLLPQGSVQLALLGDGFENRVLPLDQLAERVDRVFDRAEGRFVQAAGAFFAIPRHEGDCVALAQKLGGRLDLGRRKPKSPPRSPQLPAPSQIQFHPFGSFPGSQAGCTLSQGFLEPIRERDFARDELGSNRGSRIGS